MDGATVELWFFYGLVVLTLLSTAFQVTNVRHTKMRFNIAKKHPEDEDRQTVASADLRAEWFRLGSHGAMFISLGWLILLRWIPKQSQPPQLVSFFVFAGGLSLIPILLLLMSVNLRFRDRKLENAHLVRAALKIWEERNGVKTGASGSSDPDPVDPDRVPGKRTLPILRRRKAVYIGGGLLALIIIILLLVILG